MTTVRRAVALLLFFSAALLPLATAQDTSEESPTASTQARIHGRTPPATQDNLGPAPKFVSKPPLDISNLTPAECATLPQAVAVYIEYENEKTLWNLRKIAGIGTGYFIESCREADDAFDKAAELSGDGTNGKAFKAAADAAFGKGSECGKDFDALFAQECSDSKDAECAAASADKSQLDFLDDQNKKFKTDLAAREKEQGQLEACAKNGGKTALAAPDQVTPPNSETTQPSSQDQKTSGKKSADKSRGQNTVTSDNVSSAKVDKTSGQAVSKRRSSGGSQTTVSNGNRAAKGGGKPVAAATKLAKGTRSQQDADSNSKGPRSAPKSPRSTVDCPYPIDNRHDCTNRVEVYNLDGDCYDKYVKGMQRWMRSGYDPNFRRDFLLPGECNCEAAKLCIPCNTPQVVTPPVGDGKCVTLCSDGFSVPDPNGFCRETCKPPRQWVNYECVTPCSDGILPDATGKCPIKCTPPQVLSNGKCVTRCSDGSLPDAGGKCPVKCTLSQVLSNGKCVTPCWDKSAPDAGGNCPLQSITITQTSPGPIIAGGSAATFKAALTPTNSKPVNLSWTFHSNSVAVASPLDRSNQESLVSAEPSASAVPVTPSPTLTALAGYGLEFLPGPNPGQGFLLVTDKNSGKGSKPLGVTIESPYGKCTKERHKTLQDLVDKFCQIGDRACKGDQKCDILRKNRDKNQNCYDARVKINNECYDGGNEGHTKAARAAKNAIIICVDLIKKYCGGRPAALPVWEEAP